MKIALCVPYLGTAEMGFAVSLGNLMAMTSRTHEPEIITFRSSNLPQSRTRLVQEALRREADWLLWLDADMIFPPHSLLRLLATGKDIIGVNYPRRSTPTSPTARKAGEFVYTTPGKGALIEEVDRIGFGVLLCRASVLASLGWPMFGNEAEENGVDFDGEDGFFCDRLKSAGHQIFVDQVLSPQIGHVHDRILTNADAVADAARFAQLSS